MDRINSEGIPRSRLLHALRQPLIVRKARRMDSCLLCKYGSVNESGLCDACFTQLSDQEREVAQRWLTGEGP